MKIPIYDISINLEDEESLMTTISLVTDPAVERNFECFDKEKKPMTFSITDEEKHCITGVAIRADVPIYRYSAELGEYYVRFTKRTIEDIVYKYSKMGLWNSVSLEHSGTNISDAVMVEYFLKGKGLNPEGFEDVEEGSLFVTFKITNDELWNTIKNSDKINGFSIEIMSDIKPTGEYVEEEFEYDDLWEYLADLFKDEKKNFSVERGEIASAIDRKRLIKIDEGKSGVVDYYPYGLGKDNGDDAVVLYNPNTNKWSVRTLSSISDMIVTNQPIGEFDYTDKSYQDIIDDEDVTISRTTHTSTFSELIHNRVPVMISYNDEKPKPHTGYRQCAIIAVGLTKKGNECLRIMEMFGDSRSAAAGVGVIPDYRLLLTGRIVKLKPLLGVEKYDISVLDSRVNWTGDNGMSLCIDHIETSDF